MPANVQTMAYYGDEPWHGLGKRVPKGVTAEQMICAAGLDWEVELRPARGAREINHKREFSRYEIVRVSRPNTKEDEVLLGVVSRRYQPLQNVEAFGFFDPIVREGKAYFETAGALGEGERIWVMTIAMQAEHAQMLMAPHHAGGPIAYAAVLHTDASINHFLIQETCGSWLQQEYHRFVEHDWVITDGHINVSEQEGLGIEVKETDITKLPYEPMLFRQYRHVDGSWKGW